MKKHNWFWVAIILVGLLWLFNAFIYPLFVPSLNDRALNGDAFGSVNALFSGLAFVGLIYTILMQREELALQRNELRLQREEMKESRGELELQNKIQKAQAEIMIGHIKAIAAQVRTESFKNRSKSGDFITGLGDSNIEPLALEVETMAVRLNDKYFPMQGPDSDNKDSLNPPPKR